MKRLDFTHRYLLALYLIHRDDRGSFQSVTSLKQRFALPSDEYLESELADMLESRGWARVHRTHGAAYSWSLELLVGGREAAEHLLEQGLTLDESDSTHSPDNVVEIVGIPASDRLVPINHNAPEYSEIAAQLIAVKESVRGFNEAPEADRNRIITALEAAQTYWEALELKVIQVKVGILMAAEDAADLLANSAKAVAAALLVDAIKSFIKAHTGIDLDRI